ncbi:hypothetical protein TthHB5018_c24130 (plasmid) [Thermus thermophilus]|uniref:Uncharacterized protein n=1 Tax=Thermus thermophilus TaxID=274 RepID=A0A7R7YJA9_THETH|nr:hypothetical protein TthHB5018_c24130 [Thermus thermophilus]
MGEGREVGLQGGLGGQVAFGEVLALQQESHGRRPYLADGEGQELGQGGLLVLWLWGELEALGLQDLQFIICLDVDSHEGQLRRTYLAGFRIKMVSQPKAMSHWGVLTVWKRGTLLLSHPEGPELRLAPK